MRENEIDARFCDDVACDAEDYRKVILSEIWTENETVNDDLDLGRRRLCKDRGFLRHYRRGRSL